MNNWTKALLALSLLLSMASIARAANPYGWTVTERQVVHGKVTTTEWQGAKKTSKQSFRMLTVRVGTKARQLKVYRVTNDRIADRVSVLSFKKRKPASLPVANTRCKEYVELKSSWGSRKVCRADYATDSEIKTLLGDLRRLR